MAKYMPVLDSTKTMLVMMRTASASPADGDWAVSGNKFTLAPGRARQETQDRIKCISSLEFGSDIHVVTQQESGRVAYHVFDPGTTAWTTSDQEVGVPRLEDTNFEARPLHSYRYSVGLSWRSDGDVVVVAAYNNGAQSRACVFTREAGTWTNRGDGTSLDAIAGVVVCPQPHSSDDRIGWAMYDTDLNDVIFNSISSTNIIDTQTNLDTTTDTANRLLRPGVFLSANEFVVSYIDASDKVSLYKVTLADTPSLTQYTDRSAATVYGNGRTTAPFAAFCLAVESDDTVHLLYADASTQDLFHQPDATNVSPPSEVEELDGVTVNQISCRVVNSDANIYVAYDDAGTLKFLDISLGAAPAVQSSKLALLGVGV